MLLGKSLNRGDAEDAEECPVLGKSLNTEVTESHGGHGGLRLSS